ncbi:MAG: phosphatidylserine decarboxylase family protein, partial [Alistipes sp.]|nr:phosphatidylserine decarboxylase family protein [Alistipes sp.]
MKINKEGYWIIIITGILCLSIWSLVYFLINFPIAIMWIMAAFLLVFWFFVAAFFREPKRVQIHDDELLFSPCDGR